MAVAPVLPTPELEEKPTETQVQMGAAIEEFRDTPLAEPDIKKTLAEELVKAATEKNTDLIRKAAQKIYDAGFEPEDMKIPHKLFVVVCNALSMSGFVPAMKEPPEVPSQYRDPHL